MAQVPATQKTDLPAINQPRLPYHPGIEKRFGIDQTEWRALVESTFPAAKTVGAVILALAYCRARNLDPFKKTVHIVPIWDKERRGYVETVWPGIAEYRTTAARTKTYAGHDEIKNGPMVEKTWQDGDISVTLTFPEWSQMTVYRIVDGNKCAFPGPRVYWLETYASKKGGAPNTMWASRPIGMIDKCAEAAALRGAFPEELGGENVYEEHGGFRWHGRDAIDVTGADVPLLENQNGRAAQLADQLSCEREQKQASFDATPEPAAEPSGREPGDEPLGTEDQRTTVARWHDEIAGMGTLTETVRARKSIPTDWSDETKQAIASRIDMREAEIRGGRGGKSK